MTTKQITVGAAVVGGLVVVGGIAWAVSQAIAALIAAHPTVFGLLTLSGAVVLLLGGARIVFAFGAQQQAKAWQGAIVRLPGDLPAHVLDVPDLTNQLAQLAVERHFEVEEVRAGVSPTLTHLHQEVHAAPAGPDLLAQLLGAGGLLPPPPQVSQVLSGSGPRLQQMHESGHICRSGKSLLVGYEADQPRYIELAECGFIAVAGQPRTGKSTAVTLLLAQAALSGWHLALIDPHVHKEDGLITRCRPISGRTIRQAGTPDEAAALIRYVDKIGRARVNGDPDRTPVLLVIDEFSNFVIRGLLPDDVLAALPAMAMEYAGVGVHGIIIGHDWSKNLLGGDLGAALRRAITHRIVCRSDMQTAEFLLPSSAMARQATGLQKGQALYWGPEPLVTLEVPWLGEEDLHYAAQGVPPRPYAPRQLPSQPQRRLTSSLPAQPAAQPATPLPPTEKLPPLTNQEQILVLLESQPWLTSTEVAGRTGIDIDLVRVELSTLKNRRALEQRRAAAGKADRFEWALAKPLNELMADRTAISA